MSLSFRASTLFKINGAQISALHLILQISIFFLDILELYKDKKVLL